MWVALSPVGIEDERYTHLSEVPFPLLGISLVWYEELFKTSTKVRTKKQIEPCQPRRNYISGIYTFMNIVIIVIMTTDNNEGGNIIEELYMIQHCR